MAMDLQRLPAPVTRAVEPQLQAALRTSPVVLLQGPRASGSLRSPAPLPLAALEGSCALSDMALKSGGSSRHVVNLGVFANRLLAEREPAALWEGHERVTLLDAHRVPTLWPALAMAAKNSPPGRFLLTAAVDMASTLADPEFGPRVHPGALPLQTLPLQTLTLQLHTQMELQGGTPWLDAAFAGRLAQIQPNQAAHGHALLERVLAGGHLESIARERPRSRHAWQLKHLEALLQAPPRRRVGAKEEKLLRAFPPPPPSDLAELRQMLALDKPGKVQPLLRTLAASSGDICNFRQWGAGIDLDSKTTERYIRGLERLFLVRRLPSAGAEGAGFGLDDHPRLVKTDKLHLVDTGLLADLLGENSVQAERARADFGGVWNAPAARMLTTFVVSELLAQGAASGNGYHFAHYRDHDQKDIDLVVRNNRGDVILVDVKAAHRLGPPDTRAMAQLAQKLGKQLRLGVILYDGGATQPVMQLPNGAPLWIAPVSSLWGRLG